MTNATFICQLFSTCVNLIMIRIRFKELLANKEFEENRVITIAEVAKETGIHRATLSKIANEKGCNTVTDNLDKLCYYFDCKIEELITFIKE